jgi:hypothetical protein
MQRANVLTAYSRVRSRRWVAVLAAVPVVAAVGIWFVASDQECMPTPSREPVAMEVTLDLQPYSVARGDSAAEAPPPLVLPRGLVELTLLLLVGSESGPYDVQLHGAEQVSLASARGEALFRLRNDTACLSRPWSSVHWEPWPGRSASRRGVEGVPRGRALGANRREDHRIEASNARVYLNVDLSSGTAGVSWGRRQVTAPQHVFRAVETSSDRETTQPPLRRSGGVGPPTSRPVDCCWWSAWESHVAEKTRSWHFSRIPMTSIACWPRVDPRGVTSLYIASDSRVTWADGRSEDGHQKTFISPTSDDIFAFCGSVIHPERLLRQVETEGLSATKPAHHRHQELLLRLDATLKQDPGGSHEAFTLLHGSKESLNMAATFHLWRVEWSLATHVVDISEPLPAHSVLAVSDGSGGASVRQHHYRWFTGESGGTSRAVFSAFCDSMENSEDPFTGGAPQLVGLARSLPAQHIGVIFRNGRYLRGRPCDLRDSDDLPEFWRNELFERCDPTTMRALAGAQRHARPRQRP